jgi:voltage-gated sodium channel
MILSSHNFKDTTKKLITGQLWTTTITTLIIINTITLAMETYPQMVHSYGVILSTIDQTILKVFLVELILRLVTFRREFFKNPWFVFDFIVVAIALVPTQDAFSALRALRALRSLRLISMFPKLRKVIEGLVLAIPGLCAIAGVMAVIICTFGLIASKMYGPSYPDWFGNLHLSIFSLFQIMTLEGWPDIVRTIMKEKPFAWVFFITYILIATFSVLNLFIAVVVDAMQRNHLDDPKEPSNQLELLNMKLDLLLDRINKSRP